MKFSIKICFSKFDQIHSLLIFFEEILHDKLHSLFSVVSGRLSFLKISTEATIVDSSLGSSDSHAQTCRNALNPSCLPFYLLTVSFSASASVEYYVSQTKT